MKKFVSVLIAVLVVFSSMAMSLTAFALPPEAAAAPAVDGSSLIAPASGEDVGQQTLMFTLTKVLSKLSFKFLIKLFFKVLLPF